MLPGILDKTIVKLGLIAAIIGMLVGYHKWQMDLAYEAGVNSVKAEVGETTTKIVTGKIEDKNEDTITLREHKVAIAKAKAEAERNNKRAASSSGTVLCNTPEYTELYESLKFTAH